MFSKLIQNYILQVKDIVGAELGVTDETGVVLACSNEARVGQAYPLAVEFIESGEHSAIRGGVSFLKTAAKNKPGFIIFLESDQDNDFKLMNLMAFNISAMKQNYDEKYDRASFIKNLLTGSPVSADISTRCKELHIAYNASRVVYIVETEETKNGHIFDIIQELFPNKSKDFIITIDKERVALVKELKSGADAKEIEKTGKIIADTLSAELMVKAFVGIGSVADNIADIGKSFKEAKTTLTIGKIFLDDRYIFSYNSLGLGRLVYQLPESSCRLFLDEYFKADAFNFLDGETMLTIKKFFENNLNISETSRQLYVHRNTLVYRLDKIQKLTGLDLRNFDDAITFKIAMMVKKYLDSIGK